MTGAGGAADPVAVRHSTAVPAEDLPPQLVPDAVVELPEPPRGTRAGRNLPAAIGVGAALGLLVTVPLFTRRVGFVAVVCLAMVYGTWELVRALRLAKIHAPLLPLLAGALAVPALAWTHGTDGLLLATVVTVLGCGLWLVLDSGPDRPSVIDSWSAAGLATLYLPFLGGFAVLLTVPADGPRRVTAFIATTVCSDVGGYAAGVWKGRHPMAPSISPKKSWEGFAGSTAACVLAGSIFFVTLFGQPFWEGAVFGLAVVVAATVGDLSESMIKRDLKVKDMGTVLPGHGGLLDRLDSVLLVAPVAWLLLTAFVPLP